MSIIKMFFNESMLMIAGWDEMGYIYIFCRRAGTSIERTRGILYLIFNTTLRFL